jgi:hypothetical protein
MDSIWLTNKWDEILPMLPYKYYQTFEGTVHAFFIFDSLFANSLISCICYIMWNGVGCEWWIGKNDEGNGYALFLKCYLSICVAELRKITKNLRARIKPEISWIWSKCTDHLTVIFYADVIDVTNNIKTGQLPLWSLDQRFCFLVDTFF